MRFLRKEDPEGEFIKKYDTSSLEMVSLAGERYYYNLRFDIPTFNWL